MKIPYATIVFSLTLAVFAPLDSLASGFVRMDAASSYLGTAGAGQATDTSVSAAFNNPAGLVGVRSTQLYTGAVTAYESFTFRDDGSEGISPGFGNLKRDGVDYGAGWTGGPLLYFATPLNKKLSFGFAMMSPFGGASDFGEGWVGSHFVEEAEVLSVQASASLGYQLTDTLSIGAALGVQYLSWELNMDLPPVPYGPVNPGYITPDHPMFAELLPVGSEERIKIDDVQPYMSLGILWQPTQSTRVGLRYIPEVNHELTGKAQILAPIPDLTEVQEYNASMPFNTPSVTTLSLSHQFTPRLTVLADIEHSGWSAWKENRVIHENGPTVVVERNWQDTMGYSLGVNYQATKKTVLKLGIGYDESPIAENQLKIDPPIDRQIAYSLGLGSQLTQRLGLSLAYQYLDMGDIRVEQALFPGQVIRGHSETSVHAVQAAITFSFE